MKKVLFFAAFLLFAGMTVSAQSSSKSCSKTCTHSESAKSVSSDVSTDSNQAVVAADNDESIEVRTCEHTGNLSFYKKDVSEKSGNVSYTEVEYQEGNGEFAVLVKNDEVKSTPKAKKFRPSTKKSSCSSAKNKKGCCSSKSGKKSCSSKS